eukprot:TRINITY_DN6848_c0_g1_i1.p1 TRINITY_DN6848_c0_g1~~TRINITY_DN6848_c0_g1_i1.p1  ORF type:complete len:213 (-),score=31.03 TRINITY_DN6848_c0_g1_i1:135-773(-)
MSSFFKILPLENKKKKNDQAFQVTLQQVRGACHIPPKENNNNSSKKRKVEDGSSSSVSLIAPVDPVIPCNKVVLVLLEKLKPELLRFIENLNSLKIWIHLNIPRIEDGNNFGVSVQEETLSEIARAEDTTFQTLDALTKYFVTRAKLVSKCQKYPTVEDYVESVYSLDEKVYIDLHMSTKDLRNNHAILYDMIQKNLEKIMKPRSSHTSSMF